jgi:hypothetical protein
VATNLAQKLPDPISGTAASVAPTSRANLRGLSRRQTQKKSICRQSLKSKKKKGIS